jgi:bifunctional non-homologous end joining protein LigD
MRLKQVNAARLDTSMKEYLGGGIMTHRFVVHEHHSAHLHFDFRLELDGVLRSWAVPKGPSLNPGERRLALMVEDHPLSYIDFEGVIPKGMSGAGVVVIWDSGPYQLLERDEDKMAIILHGRILKGEFALVRLRGRGKEDQWLLIKKRDAYAREDWKLELKLTPVKKARPGEYL